MEWGWRESRGVTAGVVYIILLSYIVPGDAPVDVMATLQGSRILVTWDPPSLPNGDIISYTLYFLDSRVSVVTTFHQIQPFLPYTNYSITVSANTSVGEGPRGPEGGVVILTPQAGKLLLEGSNLRMHTGSTWSLLYCASCTTGTGGRAPSHYYIYIYT